ncbi:hypothetical protein OPQ81_011665 [Rhizoctonia solani]|nr:hypothetical protein OPQ81_011665 [Rhizoctonia solani]
MQVDQLLSAFLSSSSWQAPGTLGQWALLQRPDFLPIRLKSESWSGSRCTLSLYSKYPYLQSMGNDSMLSSGTTSARRPAASSGRTEKEQPPLPPEATLTPTTAPRASTPTAASTRTAHRVSDKMSFSKLATADPSMSITSAPKQTARSSVAPHAPPGLPAPPAPPVSGDRTPSDREGWVDISRQDVGTIEELQARVAELEAVIKKKDEEIKEYQDDLKKDKESLAYYQNKCENLVGDPYRQEVLSIRRHLQIDEQYEPWEINKRFGEIVRKVDDISRDMGDALSSFQPIGRHTTLELLKLVSRKSEDPFLAAAKPTTDIDIEDFIDFGCRALINEVLINEILGYSIFHPGLGPKENAYFCELYSQIRRKEPQVLAGRWRISTLKLHADRSYSPKEQALRLCKHTLLPFCSAVIESQSCVELIQSMAPRFEDLFTRAYNWNNLAKSSVMLDYHPQFQPPGSVFETHNTLLEGRKPKPPSSNTILLTSKLGLWSSNALGGGEEPEYSFQTKSTMLAAEYFTT